MRVCRRREIESKEEGQRGKREEEGKRGTWPLTII